MMRNALARREGPSEAGEERPEMVGFSDLPESVCQVLRRIPEGLRREISLSAGLVDKKTEEKNDLDGRLEKDMDELVAGMDIKNRELFLHSCLTSLFLRGRFQKSFEQAEAKENTAAEVARLLSLFWQNRGRRKEEVQIFNQEYYDDFFRRRAAKTALVTAKLAEIGELKESIEKTKHQKRLTKQKTDQLYSLEKELDILQSNLEIFDTVEDNSFFSRVNSHDAASRRDDERQWTEAVTIVAEYLDPAEFATVISEGLLFSLRRQHSDQDILSAVENWYLEHQTEGIFKQGKSAKAKERETKLVKHLADLISSYRRGKASGRTDNDQGYTIRLMEVTANILSKDTVKK